MVDIEALVIGDNLFPYHRFEEVGPLIERTLSNADVDVERTTDRDALLAENIEEFDVLVDLSTDSTLDEEQLDGLLSFVEEGGGYAGVHAAAVLTSTPEGSREEPVPELRELVGGHFLHHPAATTFDVNVVYSHHPVTADLEDFSVWDEPYVLDYDDDVRVLARMDHPETGDVPVAWAKPYGDGRVFYCSLGHARPAHTTTGVRKLIVNGVRWAADA